jgi:U3 small nucleolar RNA-associated protein 12
LPLLLLQTSDKVVVALRIRPDDEVLAKLARRKKRAAEKEKGKGGKKGKGVDVANGNSKADAENEEQEGVEGEIKWEDKVAVLCTVRANAKVKSFSLGPNEGLKGGVPVSPYSLRVIASAEVIQGGIAGLAAYDNRLDVTQPPGAARDQ